MVIHVAAAGNGTRMQPAIEAMGYGDLPKHLLPTGEDGGQTLVARAAEAALDSGHDVMVHANETNLHRIAAGVGHLAVPIVTDTMGSPIGPFSFTDHVAAGLTAASVAGDVFIERPDWAGFLASHEQSAYPVSFLVGRVNGYPSNAVFDINETDGRVERFRRLTAEEDGVLRNIGMYVFTMTEPVMDILDFYAGRQAGQEDQAATDLVREGLVRAHIHPERFFNINCRADYESLRGYTAALQTSSE